MSTNTVRASEVGQFAFCQRAWWYARQGEPSLNERLMEVGAQAHQRHGRLVLTAGCLRVAAYCCLIGGVVAAAASLTSWIVR